MTEETTYTESSRAMTKFARETAAREGAENLKQAFEGIRKIPEIELAVVNKLREAGRNFNICAGRAQLVLDLEGREFARRHIVPHLPDGTDLKHVALAVRMSTAFPDELTTPDELRACRTEIQQCLRLTGIQTSRRVEPQSVHERNVWSDFVSRAATLRLLIESIENESPMQDWDVDRLDEFWETVQPITAAADRARRLRLGLPGPGGL